MISDQSWHCIYKHLGEKLTEFPGAGKVFAVDLGADGLFRAVRT